MTSEMELDESARGNLFFPEDHSGDSEPVAEEEGKFHDVLTATPDNALLQNAVKAVASFEESEVPTETKDKPPTDEVFDQVMAVWGVASSESWDSSAIRLFCQNVEKKDLNALLEHIRTAWQSLWHSIPLFARQDEDKCKCEWFRKHGIEVITSFVPDALLHAECVSEAFTPELPLDSIPSGDERSKTEACIAKLCASDQDVVRIAVDEAFNKQIAALPPFAMSTDMGLLKASFKAEYYFKIIAEVSHAKENSLRWT